MAKLCPECGMEVSEESSPAAFVGPDGEQRGEPFDWTRRTFECPNCGAKLESDEDDSDHWARADD